MTNQKYKMALHRDHQSWWRVAWCNRIDSHFKIDILYKLREFGVKVQFYHQQGHSRKDLCYHRTTTFPSACHSQMQTTSSLQMLKGPLTESWHWWRLPPNAMELCQSSEQQQHWVMCVGELWSSVATQQTLFSIWDFITIQNMMKLCSCSLKKESWP